MRRKPGPNEVWRVDRLGQEFLVLVVEKGPGMKMSTNGLVRSRLKYGNINVLGEAGARRNMRWLLNYEWTGTIRDHKYFGHYVTRVVDRNHGNRRIYTDLKYIERLSDV